MYNRYIPTAEGTYRREVIRPASKEELPSYPREQTCPAPMKIAPQSTASTPLFPLHLDMQDILVLLVLVLLLLQGNTGDGLSLLITIAAFILLQ
ncbi:MAG: hypothetical protein J6K84_02965 [Oscillospiraceae bacterium]|nr:hypothetical protein [Oscillospiraceae bacterium]